MGQKTHPIGFRLGISKDWKSRYYAGRELPALLREDELLRKYLKARLGHAAIADIIIDRKPGKVVVTARDGDGRVEITIGDNGRGFNQQDVFSSRAGHFGLIGMRERAERLGGELRLESNPGSGTEVEVTVPLP